MDNAGIEGLIRRGRWDDALTASQAMLQVQPTNARLHAYEGLCRFHKQEWEGAAACFRKATVLQPDFWQAGAKLAQSLERMRRYEEALEVAREFAVIQPNDHTLQGLIRYLTPMARGRVEGWERTTYLGYEITMAGEGREG